MRYYEERTLTALCRQSPFAECRMEALRKLGFLRSEDWEKVKPVLMAALEDSSPKIRLFAFLLKFR